MLLPGGQGIERYYVNALSDPQAHNLVCNLEDRTEPSTQKAVRRKGQRKPAEAIGSCTLLDRYACFSSLLLQVDLTGAASIMLNSCPLTRKQLDRDMSLEWTRALTRNWQIAGLIHFRLSPLVFDCFGLIVLNF